MYPPPRGVSQRGLKPWVSWGALLWGASAFGMTLTETWEAMPEPELVEK